jgi:hypothetical protein
MKVNLLMMTGNNRLRRPTCLDYGIGECIAHLRPDALDSLAGQRG